MSGFSNGFRPQTCPEGSGNCLGCSFRTGFAAPCIDCVSARCVLNHTLPGSVVHAVCKRHDGIPQMRAAPEARAMYVRALVDGTLAAATHGVPSRA